MARRAAKVALNDTIIQGAIAGCLTLAGVIYAAHKGLTQKREEVGAGASKNLDDAQQKFYDNALADLHLRISELNMALATERMRSAALQIESDFIREREGKAVASCRRLAEEISRCKLRLSQLETQRGIIGAVEVETKQIEEYKP